MNRRSFVGSLLGGGLLVAFSPRSAEAGDYEHHFHGGPLDGKVLTTPKPLGPTYVRVTRTQMPCFENDRVTLKSVLRLDSYEVTSIQGRSRDLTLRETNYVR